jgi:GAF domain-containing protein
VGTSSAKKKIDEILASILADKQSTGIIRMILEATCRNFGARKESAFLLDYVSDTLHVCTYTTGSTPAFVYTCVGVSERQTQIVSDTDKIDSLVARGIQYSQEKNAESLLSVPIVAGNRSLGALCICRKPGKRIPTESQEMALQILAKLAAVQINKFSREEEAARDIEILASGVSWEDIDWAKGSDHLLQMVVDSSIRVTGAQAAVLYEYDEVSNDVKMPPRIAGELLDRQVLQERGKAIGHKESVVFKMLRREKPFYAPQAQLNWIEHGFYPSKDAFNRSFIAREAIESSAAIPLRIRSACVGVLFLNYQFHQEFSETTRRRVDFFANYATMAILNSRRLNSHFRKLEEIQDIGNAIDAYLGSSVREICGFVNGQVRRVMYAENFIVCMFDEKTRSCKPCYMRDEKDLSGDFSDEQWDRGLCATVCKTGVPMLKNNRGSKNRDRAIGSPAMSWLGVPMKAKGRVIGAMAVQSYDENVIFTTENQEVLSTLAAQTATAIEHFNRLNAAEREMRGLNGLWSAVEISILSTRKTRLTASELLMQAITTLEADGGVVFRFDSENREFQAELIHGLPWDPARRLRWNEGLTGKAVQQRTTLVQHDYLNWPGHLPELEDPSFRKLTESVIASGLMRDDEVVGALTITSNAERAFGESDKELFDRFARLIAVYMASNDFLEE